MFIGIKEDSKTTRASEFLGIDKSDLSKVLEKIRNGATSSANPEIYYDAKVIDGPVEAIGLQGEKSIIIVGIPEGVNPPYISSNGKIYQRFSDSSRPFDVKEVKDRYSLDNLYKKREKINKYINLFINRRISIPERYRELPYIEITLFADLRFPTKDFIIKFRDFSEAVEKARKLPITLSLDSVYPIDAGFCARDTKGSFYDDFNSFVYVSRTGDAKIILPLNSFLSPEQLRDYYALREQNPIKSILEFSKHYRKDIFNEAKIVDFSYVYVMVQTCFKVICSLLNDVLKAHEIHYNIEVFNIANTVPFVAIEGFYKDLKTPDMPLFLFDNIKIPLEPFLGSLRVSPLKDNDDTSVLGFAGLMVFHILSCYGVFKGIEDAEMVIECFQLFFE